MKIGMSVFVFYDFFTLKNYEYLTICYIYYTIYEYYISYNAIIFLLISCWMQSFAVAPQLICDVFGVFF